MGRLSNLEKLAALRETGVLTDEEFEREKRRIIRTYPTFAIGGLCLAATAASFAAAFYFDLLPRQPKPPETKVAASSVPDVQAKPAEKPRPQPTLIKFSNLVQSELDGDFSGHSILLNTSVRPIRGEMLMCEGRCLRVRLNDLRLADQTASKGAISFWVNFDGYIVNFTGDISSKRLTMRGSNESYLLHSLPKCRSGRECFDHTEFGSIT